MDHSNRLAATIDRIRRGFWDKATLDRRLAAVIPDRAWAPIGFLRQPFSGSFLSPATVHQSYVRTEYEDCFAARAVTSDDWIPYSAAWRAVPWLEAICGCRVRYAAGSMAPEPYVPSAAALAEIGLPASAEWLDRLRERTQWLAATLPDGCWVSTTILRGSSDVLAAMRGIDGFFLDLHDDPRAISAAAARVNQLHADVLDMHFGIVPPRHGGYGHIFGYWAPGPTTVLQADVMGLCSPALYRDLFLPHDAELVRRLGSHVLFHLHSTGMRHYRDVLSIPGLAGLELTLEANGPEPAALLPALREILERSRLILVVDGHFDKVPALLRALPTEGLYLGISDKFVADDPALAAFLRTI